MFGWGGARARATAIERTQAVVEFSPDGRVLRGNDLFLATMGYSAREVRGQRHAMFMPPEEVDSPGYQAFWEALRRGEFQAGEFRRIGRDGREVWLQATYTPIRGLGGRVARVVKFATDITAAKQRAADDQGQIAAINRVQAVIEFALDSTILHANPNFLSALGYTLEEVRGQRHAMFVAPEERDTPAYRAFWEALRRGEPQAAEFRRIAKDGREVWIQASYNPVLDAAGRPVKVVKFATDITQEVRLRRSFALLSLVANETDNSVIITDAQGRIEYVNPGFSRLTGYSAEEALGCTPGSLLQGRRTDPGTVRRVGEHLRRGEPFYEEILNYSKSGEAYWVSLSINPVRGAEGAVERYVSVQANITGTKQRAVEADARLDAIERSNVVIEWDAHGSAVRLNELALTLLDVGRGRAEPRRPVARASVRRRRPGRARVRPVLQPHRRGGPRRRPGPGPVGQRAAAARRGGRPARQRAVRDRPVGAPGRGARHRAGDDQPAGPDQPGRGRHLRHLRADQPAGAERHHRGGARRRGRQGLRGGRGRGEEPGAALRQLDRADHRPGLGHADADRAVHRGGLRAEKEG